MTGSVRIGETSGPAHPDFRLPARWSIRVHSSGEQPTIIKLAIGFDDTLEVIEAGTPLTFDFVASGYTALIAATSPDARLQVDVWSDVYGEFQKNGGFGGSSRGKLTFQPAGPIYSSSGTSF